MTQSTAAYAAKEEKGALNPFTIERREVGPDDVQIEIEYCGVCHSDLHQVNNDWNGSKYPIVPGHEIIGRVTAVGDNVNEFKVGERAAVGCMVGSCGDCENCADDLEQYCLEGFVGTYNGPTDENEYGHTFGGYSKRIVTDKHFVLHVPENLDPAGTAPLLCAGITTYSPLRHWNVGEGMTVGVIGLGGLGHMGVKLASAMGAKVVMITRSPEKGDDAKALGADKVLISTDEKQMEAYAGKFDFLLNTIPVPHDVNPYVTLLKPNSTMCLVGVIQPVEEIHMGAIIVSRKALAGSLIGGIKETQEMLDFCGEHDITADIEEIKMDEINDAYDRMVKSDVKYRFVIDMDTLEEAA